MNHNEIEKIFLETTALYPLDYYHPSMVWFNAILKQLTTPQPLPDFDMFSSYARKASFVDTKVNKVILENQTMLTFSSMYLHLLMEHVDEKSWNVKNFNSVIKMLFQYRKQSLHTEAKMAVKVWLNMIFGAANNSNLISAVDIRAVITGAGYNIMAKLFERPSVIYIDTDLVVISDDIESVKTWLPAIMPTDNPYFLETAKTVAIFRAHMLLRA
jgi:hypothetical protein